MRLPLLFVFVRKSFVRKSVATWSDHTCREPHHAHFAEQLRHLRIGVVRCSEARPQIVDALRISCVRAADQKQSLRVGPAFAK